MKRNKWLSSVLLVVLGAALYSLSMTMFVNEANLFPGGFAGLSILIIRLTERYLSLSLPFGVIYLLFNIFPTVLVFRYVGKRFTLLSVLHVVLVSIFIEIFPPMTMVHDTLLMAVFGGLLSGFGLILSLQADACGGGTDFIAIYMANKYHKSMWNYMFIGNAVVLVIAGALFGWEQALYSIIYQYSSTQLINTLHQRYKLVALTIITDYPDEITAKVLSVSQHSMTKLWGEGAYSKKPKCMLYMVINAFEVREIVKIVQSVDPHVFISEAQSQRIIGNFTQKPYD